MAQVFHPSANTLARVTIFGGIFLVSGALLLAYLVIRSPYQTEVHVVKDQPVQFSHEHHVRGLGIDCRYCHSSVEESSYAGMPPTYTCMSCHSQIWTDSPMLAQVRQSLAEDEAIRWNRIHDIPDYAYFNHSIHIKKGVGCYSCHGRVNEMPLAWKEESMTMGWCLECHRNPEEHLRPHDEIYDLEWSAETDQADLVALFEAAVDAESISPGSLPESEGDMASTDFSAIEALLPQDSDHRIEFNDQTDLDELKAFVEQVNAKRDQERALAEQALNDGRISQTELGMLLASRNEVPTLGHNTPLTNCAVCHR